MEPKFGKKSTMSSVTPLTRSAAAYLVHREEKRTGSRMVAYEIVAQTVGTSADWIRKFISPSYGEAKQPGMEVGFNILAFYDRVVSSVDHNAEKIEADNRALRKQIHEATPRTLTKHLAAHQQDRAEDQAVARET